MVTDEYMNYLRNQLAESAFATLTQDTIKTGLSYAQMGLAIEIHEIVHTTTEPEDLPSTGAIEKIENALAAESGLTSIPGLQEPNLLYWNKLALMAGVGTYLPLLRFFEGHPRFFVSSPPMLYAFPDLFHYVLSTNSSAAATGKFRIGFLYVDIGTEKFFEVLQQFQQTFG